MIWLTNGLHGVKQQSLTHSLCKHFDFVYISPLIHIVSLFLISEGLPSVRSMKWNISKHDKPMILIDWNQLIDMIDYTFSYKYFVNFQISQLWVSFV
jgi:hypothetical protein